jgi:NADH dehydrogenase FAD-containing subunit
MGASQAKIEKRLANKPVVVVIGGGYAGAAVAGALDSVVNVVVIERKTFFWNNIGALRAAVQGDPTRVSFSYDSLLKFGHVINAEVTSVNPHTNSLTVHGHAGEIHFDYLVIATGSSYSFPMKVAVPEASRSTELLRDFSEEVARAKNIVIVGGGPVGVELAGEICDKFPGLQDKRVTIVHSTDTLVPGPTPEAFKAEVKRRIESLGVEVVLGERVVVPDAARASGEDASATESNTSASADTDYAAPAPGLRYLKGKRDLRTREGRQLNNVDLTIFATGAAVNSASYEGNRAFELTPDHRIIVDDHLKPRGIKNVFAIGDCGTGDSAKLAYTAGIQANYVASVIKAEIEQKPTKPYKPLDMVALVVPMGRNEGVSALGAKVLGKTVTGMIKGKDLFYKKALRLLNKPAAAPSDELPVDIDRLATRLGVSHEEAKAIIEQGAPISHSDVSVHT